MPWGYIAVGLVCGFLGLLIGALACAAGKADDQPKEPPDDHLDLTPRRPDAG